MGIYTGPFRWTPHLRFTDYTFPVAMIIGEGMLHGGHARVTARLTLSEAGYWDIVMTWQSGDGFRMYEGAFVVEERLPRVLAHLFSQVRKWAGAGPAPGRPEASPVSPP